MIGIMARLLQSGWGVCPMIAQDGDLPPGMPAAELPFRRAIR
jgi:hypothetical protein